MAGSAAKAAHDAKHRMGASARVKIFILFSAHWTGETRPWKPGFVDLGE